MSLSFRYIFYTVLYIHIHAFVHFSAFIKGCSLVAENFLPRERYSDVVRKLINANHRLKITRGFHLTH